MLIKDRFRGFLPVVIDVETGGLNPNEDALLEVAAVCIQINDQGDFCLGEQYHNHVEAHPDTRIHAASLALNKIDPDNPLRNAVSESTAINEMFTMIRKQIKLAGCNRAILTAHNAFFDRDFIMTAADRSKVKRNPFHPFSTFDTSTLAGVALGHTVLARACEIAQIEFSQSEAHGALYDTLKTAELFCHIANRCNGIFHHVKNDES